jgi:hypothetical protein
VAYGQLDRKQTKALRAFVRGRDVHDLGCGDQMLSRELVRFGARQVVAVDSHPFGNPGPKVRTVHATFEDYVQRAPEIDISFVSWPANRVETALLDLLRSSRAVVYLGKCTDGTACGYPELFDHFLGRDILSYIPHEHNTLCIYGGRLSTRREGELEERAGMDWKRIWPYYGVSNVGRIGENHGV